MLFCIILQCIKACLFATNQSIVHHLTSPLGLPSYTGVWVTRNKKKKCENGKKSLKFWNLLYFCVHKGTKKSLKLRKINLNSDFNLNSHRPAYKGHNSDILVKFYKLRARLSFYNNCLNKFLDVGPMNTTSYITVWRSKLRCVVGHLLHSENSSPSTRISFCTTESCKIAQLMNALWKENFTLLPTTKIWQVLQTRVVLH